MGTKHISRKTRIQPCVRTPKSLAMPLSGLLQSPLMMQKSWSYGSTWCFACEP